jgi:hypothetical protein
VSGDRHRATYARAVIFLTHDSAALTFVNANE